MSNTTEQDDRERLITEALKAADSLCTAVIQGRPGQQVLALRYARVLDDAKRLGIKLSPQTTCTNGH